MNLGIIYLTLLILKATGHLEQIPWWLVLTPWALWVLADITKSIVEVIDKNRGDE